MPRYAWYDHTLSDPKPVKGWFDSDLLHYPTLPALADLLPLTDAQWNVRMAGPMAVSGGVLVAALTPPPSNPQLAATEFSARITTGLALTCTGNAALNKAFALDPTTMAQIGSVARDFAAGLGLPGGSASFTYPDMAGEPCIFTGARLVALYKAQRDLLLALNTQAAIMANGGTPSWPLQTATIA